MSVTGFQSVGRMDPVWGFYSNAFSHFGILLGNNPNHHDHITSQYPSHSRGKAWNQGKKSDIFPSHGMYIINKALLSLFLSVWTVIHTPMVHKNSGNLLPVTCVLILSYCIMSIDFYITFLFPRFPSAWQQSRYSSKRSDPERETWYSKFKMTAIS